MKLVRFAILLLIPVPCFAQETAAEAVVTKVAKTETESVNKPKVTKDRAAILKSMQEVAKKIEITRDGEPVRRDPKPIFRFDDPARKFSDGSVWVWGTKGRPDAIVTIARNTPKYWLTEVTSLLDKPIKVQGSREMKEPCQFKSIPGVDAPRKSEKLRKSQMKLLARSFRAYQMWDNDGSTKLQRYELRISTPTYEYKDESRGVLSGAVFLFNYGSNPELALIIEATKDGWRSAFGRMGWASASVTYKGKPFYEQPKMSSSVGDGRYMMVSLLAEDRP